MTTQANQTTTVEQGALFGDPVTVPSEHGAASTAATQDVGLVASVLRLAQDPGYRIVARSGRVFRVDPAGGGAVDEVPRYEADTVGQLLDGGLLELGGNHTITHRGHTGPARSVLVPKRSREMATRWSNLRPLPTATRRAREAEEEQTSGPIGVDVVRPGRGLVTCREFHGELIRQDGRYLVETEFGHVVGTAPSYRAGARMLARHHGYRPGPIEIEHEHRIYGRS